MATAPYDVLITAINAANTRMAGDVNTLQPIGGQILKFSNAYSQQLTNTAWRRFQQLLVAHGEVRLRIPNFIIPNLPPVNNADVALQVTLSWSGYFDGINQFPAITLPQNLIRPLRLGERPSAASPNIQAFTEIDLGNIDRIPSVPKKQWNGIAVWNDDQVSMPGALVATDLRVDYAAYLADFLDTGNTTATGQYTRWFNQQIPILRALEPLTSYICAESQRALGNADAGAAYTSDAEAQALTAIMNEQD